MPCLRLVFMASAEFALPVLAALLDAGHEIVCVYSRPPRPAGRGHRERPSPVHAFAAEKAISVRTPKSLDGKDDQAAFAALAADAAVVAAYGLILPAPVLDAPRLGCLNVHASLLPRWRGAAPIERAIIAGDEQSGVTIIRMNEGLDSGPMVLGESVPITAETTAGDLRGALCGLGARLIVEALDGLAEGCLTPMPQPSDGVTYARKLDRGEGRLDWSRPAAELERLVRALAPWPGVWFEHQGARIKVLAAQVVEAAGTGSPGTVLDDRLAVACGAAAAEQGALRLVRVQRAGKQAVAAEDFLRGYPLPQGSRLS
ncbi:MAG: methionyl-tRNA formyltransferase [Rhodospirillales bacterium]|jgi:methionyl-tRNA formyltransferase|nr:methionyl-tRNA formyltransferase [Rhodospirillales bacterium]MDP7099355.1 methionyl-tRNA formyltransferase [Rhodospirillales bacterium]MDP7214858.1 methionyl-tRNA formyltransferase [Rhodospirillales bacterium]HIJ93281.1 methionyl-tRNA formyltransferase [Rhodospirillaceae bacterium]HJP54577.1 methionyl-tRNA formyltransferase [Rhodospirillales bacterium]